MIDMFMGQYRWLSNFHEAPILYKGLVYLNNEGAYQAQKTTDPLEKATFIRLSGSDARKKGQTVTCRSDWNDVRIEVMKTVTHAKYTQHLQLMMKLVDTGDHELIERNYWGDTFWGVCNGVGENNLGKILMEERALLKKGLTDAG